MTKFATITTGLIAFTALCAGSAHSQSLRVGNTGADLSAALQGYGYRAFRVIDREVVRTVVEACRGDTKYRVSVNILGAVKTKERLGRCDLGKRANRGRKPSGETEIRARLRDRGFNRLKVTDRTRNGYAFIACNSNGRRVALAVSQRGRVRTETPIGRCAERLDANALTKTLRSEGYTRVSVKRQDNRLRAEACLGSAKLALTFRRNGGQASRERIGDCQSWKVSDVTERLRKRGAKDPKVFAEGCFQKVRYRWSFNDLGDRTGRKRIGDC